MIFLPRREKWLRKKGTVAGKKQEKAKQNCELRRRPAKRVIKEKTPRSTRRESGK